MNKKLPELFDILPWDDELVLTSGDELNDARWGAWFGAIQSLLRDDQINGTHFKNCHINLSECYWADPLPLLSLALTLIEYERKGGKVSITFPGVPRIIEIDGSNKDNAEIKQARLLKFLARDGFISLLTRPVIAHLPGDSITAPFSERVIKFGTSVLGSDDIDSLKDLPVSLAFERSTCLLATLLDLRCPTNEDDNAPHNSIDEWVEQVLFQSISQSVYDEAPSWAQDGLRYRLMSFLRETLHNVIEHAYKGSQSGLAAVYVRYREGALGEAPATWKRISVFSEREDDQNKVPLMKTQSWRESFPNTRTGFFEVFVLDAGQGLCRTLGEYPSKDGSDPLHKAMLEVFDLGRSSKNVRPTEFGGLYLVGELLTPNEDYVRALDEGTWWGTQLPLKKTQTGSQPAGRFTIKAYGKEFGNDGIRGLAWTARLSWLEAQDVPGHKQPWRGIGNQKEQQKVLAVFRGVDETEPATMPVRDVRFPSYHSPVVTDAILSHDNPAMLLLPEPRWMKNHIQDEIRKFLALFKDGCVNNSSLIIGDIRPEEAVTYLAAIVGAKTFTLAPFNSVMWVILVTRELKVCVLQRNQFDGLFEPSNNETKAFVLSNPGTPPQRSLVEYLRTLRRYDGQRLREIVAQSPSDSQYTDFVAEEVDWRIDIVLKGYLDFPQTLTHPLCREIYSLSLQRLTGLFPKLDCHLVALDSLVDSLVTRFNAQRHPRPASKQEPRKPQPIHIGSIKVSGLTERAGKQARTPVFHFFRHPSGNADGYFLLPWIGPSEITSPLASVGRYRRVGETPVIARDGWKAYPLPRFDKDGNSVYEKSPRDSYRAWQEPSRTPMKLGHWCYGGHHEILTINLLLAFDTELDRISLALGGSLARYIYANLFHIFGVGAEDLNEQGKKLLPIIANDAYRRILSLDVVKKSDGREPLLVYSAHPVTDHIIDRFLGLLSEESLRKIRSRLIAILPVRRHRSGSGLQVSGITLERLSNAANQDTPVVYFDDGVISGRTYEEIKRLLRDKGFRDIYSMVLLDRQRLPSSDHMQNGKHVGYWRLDVPSLGGKAHCPLCHAIDRVQALRDSIASTAHRNRIDSWCQTWKERDPSTQWGDAGLRPIPLTLKKPGRKFCVTRNTDGSYSQIGGDTQQIRLTNSAGLIAWVTELHCITSRDDLPLEMLKRESLSSEVRIQLIASQLLLFISEFDVSHAKKLIIALLQALWDSPAHDRHTALAVLTLVSCGDDLLNVVINEFLDSDKLFQLKDRNVDLVLLKTLSMVTDGNKIGQTGVNVTLDVCSRLLKPSGKPDLYYRLHREVKDALGKAHSSPLHRLEQTKDHAHFEAKEILMDMLASAAQLRVIVQTIPWHWLRANTKGHEEFRAIKVSIDESEEKLRQAVVKLQGTEESDGQHQKQFEDAKKSGKALLENGDKLHFSLFVPLGIHNMEKGHAPPFLDQLKQFHCEFPAKSGEKKIACWHVPGLNESKELRATIKKPEIEEAFVVWDAEIREALQDIISNVRHATAGNILDPWGKKTESANQWCRINMNEFSFQIEMINKSDKNALTVMREVEGRHSHHVLGEIGGCVKYSDTQDGLLLTSISLPYAHTLQTGLLGERL